MRRFALAACLLVALPASPQSTSKVPAMPAILSHAKGSFDVKIVPTTHAPDPSLASYSLDKIFHGDLEGTGKGEMLSAGDPKTGNAGYVAMERITGTLLGHEGSFAVMQVGTMSTGNAPQLTATIVPGSGTGALSGIFGSMTIDPTNGKHTYTVDYGFSAK